MRTEREEEIRAAELNSSLFPSHSVSPAKWSSTLVHLYANSFFAALAKELWEMKNCVFVDSGILKVRACVGRSGFDSCRQPG